MDICRGGSRILCRRRIGSPQETATYMYVCKSKMDTEVKETGTAKIEGDEGLVKGSKQRNRSKRKCMYTTRRKRKKTTHATPSVKTECDNEPKEHLGKTQRKKRKRKPRPKSHICSDCGQGFSVPSSLRIHRRKHTGEKPYFCQECGKKFAVLSALKVHQRVHSGEKPYVCGTCGMHFSQNGNLAIHMRRHTGEKPYTCEVCGHSFTQKVDMLKHTSVHSLEKPFICHQCGMAFRHRTYLQRHLKFHATKEFQCEFCPKSFTSGHELRRHVRSHTGEKPHVCNRCGKAFAESGRLTLHIRIHTGEKPFACGFCSYRCNDKGNLGKHMKRHGNHSKDCKDLKQVNEFGDSTMQSVSESQSSDCLYIPNNHTPSPAENNTSIDDECNYMYNGFKEQSDKREAQEMTSSDLKPVPVGDGGKELPTSNVAEISTTDIGPAPFVVERTGINPQILDMVFQKIAESEGDEYAAVSKENFKTPVAVSHEEAVKAIDTILSWLHCQPEAENTQIGHLHHLHNLALSKCGQH